MLKEPLAEQVRLAIRALQEDRIRIGRHHSSYSILQILEKEMNDILDGKRKDLSEGTSHIILDSMDWNLPSYQEMSRARSLVVKHYKDLERMVPDEQFISSVGLKTLPGGLRDESSAFYRDEVVWAPSGLNFALAYTIREVSMNNQVGHLAWGSRRKKDPFLIKALPEISVDCSNTPWCRWLSDTCFVFRAQKHLPNKKTFIDPLIAIDIKLGHYVYDKSGHDYLVANFSEKVPPIPQHFNSFNDLDLETAVVQFGAK